MLICIAYTANTTIMANTYFQFKQFTVHQDRCAMKVGTDGCLLGAWGAVKPGGRVLDIGTGTGLVALMAAQRGATEIQGVEIDPDAAQQAAENVRQSPWKDRIEIVCADFSSYSLRVPEEQRFDSILSNPPYFENALRSDDDRRTWARHDAALNYAALFEGAVRLLHPDGILSLVTPADVEERLAALAYASRLHPVRKCYVSGRFGNPPKRLLSQWSLASEKTCVITRLAVEFAPKQFTPEYEELMRDYYLHL